MSGGGGAGAGAAGAPITGVPKDLTREELALAFRVIEALRGMRFGSVQVQVHNGQVVQIDVAEKLRLRDPSAGPGAGPAEGSAGRGAR
jgi:hypothetical protein